MRLEDSPFTPGRLVPFEFFVGRFSEIERVSLVGAGSHGWEVQSRLHIR